VSQAAYEEGLHKRLGLQKQVLPVRGIRNLTKRDMKHNGETPDITVDPQTFDVKVDGELITCEPVDVVPMAQRYYLF
jgi:urease subunit alpha